MVFIIYVAVYLLFVLICYLYQREKRRFDAVRIPGPLAYPIIGNAHQFLNGKNLLKIITDLKENYGDVVRVWLGPCLCVFLSDPKDVKLILTSPQCATKGEFYKFTKSWLGDGLLTSNGKQWQMHRRLIGPSFNEKSVQQYFKSMRTHAEKLVESLTTALREDGEGEVEVEPFVQRCIMDILCESAMGIQMHSQETRSDSRFTTALKEIAEMVRIRSFNPLIHPEITFNMSGVGKKFRKQIEFIYSTINNIIRQRSDQSIQKNKEEFVPFLDKMLSINEFSLEDIRSEVSTFMFAGNETTACALKFAIYNLSTHPDVQEKAYKEISEEWKNDLDDCKTLKCLQSLLYLDAFLNESMRLYTVAPLISRTINQEIILPSGHKLPAGCQIFINSFSMHRNAQSFAQPEKLIVDRFLKKNATYCAPFSDGLRNCIGKTFAMAELKIILATLLSRYRILPPRYPQELELVSDIILKTRKNIKVKMIPRL